MKKTVIENVELSYQDNKRTLKVFIKPLDKQD